MNIPLETLNIQNNQMQEKNNLDLYARKKKTIAGKKHRPDYTMLPFRCIWFGHALAVRAGDVTSLMSLNVREVKTKKTLENFQVKLAQIF